MRRELSMIVEAQQLLRLAENNLRYEFEDLDLRKLTILRQNLNELVRELQYSEEYDKSEE